MLTLVFIVVLLPAARYAEQVRCEVSQLLPVANLMFNCFINKLI